ncbi:hypothetical protein EGI32_13790 [Ferruginibacter sp. HRS2-29]|nr:hypothetical protein [Ferruginibacter sp. HRS2-29]
MDSGSKPVADRRTCAGTSGHGGFVMEESRAVNTCARGEVREAVRGDEKEKNICNCWEECVELGNRNLMSFTLIAKFIFTLFLLQTSYEELKVNKEIIIIKLLLN